MVRNTALEMNNFLMGKRPVRKRVTKKNLTWTQAKRKYPKLNALKDSDGDRVKNYKDCRPFDRKRQDEKKTITIEYRVWKDDSMGEDEDEQTMTKKEFDKYIKENRKIIVNYSWEDGFILEEFEG